jgi:hypothetical protein
MESEQRTFSIETLLTRRLKGMGILFFALSCATLLFAFFAPQTPLLLQESFVLDENSILADIERLAGRALFTDMQPLELTAAEVLNFYYIAGLFSVIGIMLLYRSRKRDEEENLDHR